MAYKFNHTIEPAGAWPVLPEGDYKITVTSASVPKETEKGYDHVAIELLVEGQRVWDNRYAGTSDKGEFDMISPFLVANNRIPKQGQELSPTFWASLSGARGKAHIICETYQGITRNKVKTYHAPHQLGAEPPPPRQNYSQQEYDKAMKKAIRAAGGDDQAPEDIPF